MTAILKSAFVIGYTGAVGREVVKALVESKRFEKIVLIGRRKIEYEDPAFQELEQQVIDYEKLSELKETFAGFDAGFCCLGSTRKDAGSAEAFRHIDFDYVHQVAVHCKEGGTKHFHYVSSAGADKNSFFLYPKVKGQIEDALSKLMFPRLTIYRPKVLLRGDKARGMEGIFTTLTKPLEYLAPHSIVTGCDTVAWAMINNCDTAAPSKPSEILFNGEIYKLSEKKASAVATEGAASQPIEGS